MKIYDLSDERFRQYGRVVTEVDCTDMLRVLEQTEIPEKVVYVASCEVMEACESRKAIEDQLFGGLPIQCGYCNGHNQMMDAVEYHKSSEINLMATDLVLLLGKEQDITEQLTYDSGKLEAFFVPKGTALEMYATTLHYAPCMAHEEGFQMAVILPRGTNTDLASAAPSGEGRILFQKNKWLLAHREAGILGAYCGIQGENLRVETLKK